MTLEHRTILVTRPRNQSRELVAEIERRGGKAVVIPLIRIAPPDSWDDCDRSLRTLGSFDAVALVSANGARSFFGRCRAAGLIQKLGIRPAVYAVGEGTTRAVERESVPVSFVPVRFDAAALGEELPEEAVRGKRFLLPRGDLGRDDLAQCLRMRGADVTTIVVYRTLGPDPADAEDLTRRLGAGEFDAVTLASPSAARNFAALLSENAATVITARTIIAVVGTTTAEAARAIGIPVHAIASRPTASGVADSIATSLLRGSNS